MVILGSTVEDVTESKLLLLAAGQANKLRDELLGARNSNYI